MGLTVTRVTAVRNQPLKYGQLNSVIVDLTGDNSFAAGGEAITAAQLGFHEIIGMKFLGVTDGADEVFDAVLDIENLKVIFVDEAGVIVTGDATGQTVRCEFIGV